MQNRPDKFKLKGGKGNLQKCVWCKIKTSHCGAPFLTQAFWQRGKMPPFFQKPCHVYVLTTATLRLCPTIRSLSLWHGPTPGIDKRKWRRGMIEYPYKSEHRYFTKNDTKVTIFREKFLNQSILIKKDRSLKPPGILSKVQKKSRGPIITNQA